MSAYAIILSENQRFSRMLSHELSYMRISCMCVENIVEMDSDVDYNIILADLDFCGNGGLRAFLGEKKAVELSNKEIADNEVLVIGWSGVDTPEYYEDFSLCSAFLHRPFLISDLRYIIAGYFSLDGNLGSAASISDDNGYLTYISRLRRIAEISGKRFDEDNKEERCLSCDSDSMTAIYGEKKFPLSEYEYKVLSLLCEKRGELVTREEISKMLGGEMSNMSDVYICHLRRKIDSSLGLKLILTVRGKGYMIK